MGTIDPVIVIVFFFVRRNGSAFGDLRNGKRQI
jgi:hypothetical protein